MKEDLNSIYVWVEVSKRSIPHQFEEILKTYLVDNKSEPLNPHSDFQVFGMDDESYFICTKAFYKNRKYLFSFFTGGWFHLNYKLYIEVDLSKKITPFPFPGEKELKKIDDYLLSELSISHENKVIINGKEYLLRFSRVLPAQDCFEFVPLKRANIIDFLKKILFS